MNVLTMRSRKISKSYLETNDIQKPQIYGIKAVLKGNLIARKISSKQSNPTLKSTRKKTGIKQKGKSTRGHELPCGDCREWGKVGMREINGNGKNTIKICEEKKNNKQNPE